MKKYEMNETLHSGLPHVHDGHHAATHTASGLKDPVCGMTVTDDSPHHLGHAGQEFYFCSAKCQTRFAAEPERYTAAEHAKPVQPTAAAAQPGTIYTCPMHPQIRQDHPGDCPICGMSLEPELPSLEEEANPELIDFQRRFWWTLPFTLAVLLLAMAGHRLRWFEGDTQNWIELVLTLPVALWAGWPFYKRGVQSVVNRSPNMWTLIGLGTSVAFVYSAVATLAPRIFPAAFVVDGRVGVYFEAAAVIISLTLLGQLLELKARSQTSAANQVAARPRAQDRAPHRPGRDRGGRSAVERACGRPAARATRREGAGRRRRGRRQQRARRVDADRRAAAGLQARGRPTHRRHHEHQRRAGHALGARGLDHRAVADRADGRAGASARARRCSAWPTWWRATSS